MDHSKPYKTRDPANHISILSPSTIALHDYGINTAFYRTIYVCMHKPCIKPRSLMNYTNPMHHTIFNELYLFICIKVQYFNRLDEFIHIICIEKKETILIGGHKWL